ncbi:ABC transporter permease [Halomonas sp. QX-2]|uniref:Transport permease protein n=1 Tax=Vreelandella sedimenti TaxID=2729618 RepID=A0A7Z0N9V7_9GAMM|nr:ABC transporter permease [Halomonas sedimenti]NYT74324.1 ABC transporter permease [Halomonas sedimenti]
MAARFKTAPRQLIASVNTHHQLLLKLIWRDVVGRYRGSLIGLLWSFVTPLIMLAVYTFVFTYVFQARWNVGEGEPRALFALVLFSGLMLHGLLAEVLNRSPSIIINNVNYVKKVVFPLELLPIVILGAALFHFAINVGVMLLAMLLMGMPLHATILLYPLVVLPLVPLTLGLGWGLAALGVFVRDIGQLIGIVTTILLFLSPIFFPLDALPPLLQKLLVLNPLTIIIENARNVLLWGEMPNWGALMIYSVVALAVFLVGFVGFQALRKGFADVL